MRTAIRDWSWCRWMLVVVGVTIAASFGVLGFVRNNSNVSLDDSPPLAAEILLSRPFHVVDDKSADSVWFDDQICDSKLIARIARSETFLKRVAQRQEVAVQLKSQQAQDLTEFLRQNLKVTIPDTNCVRVEFESGSEAGRAVVANAIMEALVKELDRRVTQKHSNILESTERKLSDIRLTLADWRRAEQRLRKRIASDQGEEVSAGIAFPSGLRERHGALALKKIEIDSQIAAMNDVKDADDPYLRELSIARRAVELQLEQIKKMILEEATPNVNILSNSYELSKLQASIRSLAAQEETYFLKVEQLRPGPPARPMWERCKDASPAISHASDPLSEIKSVFFGD